VRASILPHPPLGFVFASIVAQAGATALRVAIVGVILALGLHARP
jgi:hypothetical protein